MKTTVKFLVICVVTILLTYTVTFCAVDITVSKTNDNTLSETNEENGKKQGIRNSKQDDGSETNKQDEMSSSQLYKQCDDDSCVNNDDNCDSTDYIERNKYIDSDDDIHGTIANINDATQGTDEDIIDKSNSYSDDDIHGAIADINDATQGTDKDIDDDSNSHTNREHREEFPKLSRIDPGNVGDIVDMELEDGQFYKRITRSVHPPIFEIPNYLSSAEIRFIISAALNNGMVQSEIFGESIDDFFKSVDDLSKIPRVSEQAWVTDDDMPRQISERLRNRLKNLTQLPYIYLEHSEDMQVVSYIKSGHYHAHLDTSDTHHEGHLPCCFQAPHCTQDLIDLSQLENCCRICRYITVLYFLNDVEEGGETAFPLADISDKLLEEKLNEFDDYNASVWDNLSYSCSNASVVVKPKIGTAVMWYNHLIDEAGYLGNTDYRSFHGGCDVIKGNKWIANNWIVGSPYNDRGKIAT